MEKLSNCCGALPIGETHDDMGFCSECREHAVFESEEEQMTETFDNIEKALEGHFSLHDVAGMMDLLHKYREYEHKLIRNYSEDDFNDFLKQYKAEEDNDNV